MGHNLVGVDEAKSGCGHILGFSDVEKLLTLSDINGNFTPLSAMLFILRMIFDSEFLQGGKQDFGKTLSVQAVTANPGSCHPWWVVARENLAESLLKRKS